MKSLSWILFVARRYLRERRSSRGPAAGFLSTAGIAVGDVTLDVVIGVMNGFQLGFIEDILEIRSYDLRISSLDMDEAREASRLLRDLPEVRTAVPFMEVQTLAKGRFSGHEAVEVRGLPRDAARLDPGLITQLSLVQGGFLLSEGLVIGRELARALGVRLGDSITLAALTGEGYAGLVPSSRELTVSGIFHSGFYEYDRGLIFTSLKEAGRLASGTDSPRVGIKLENRYRVSGLAEKIDTILGPLGPDRRIVSWKEFNRAFFGALRMEKLTMSLLIGVMFLVVAGNIYHSLRRGVQEKRTAIAVLRAVGGTKGEIQMVFILEGALIGLAGTFWGLSLGLLIVSRINGVFVLLEQLSQGLLVILNSLFGLNLIGGFSISPTTFYLTEVPVRIVPGELFLIGFFALGVSVLSAWGASRDVAAMNPSSILRYE